MAEICSAKSSDCGHSPPDPMAGCGSVRFVASDDQVSCDLNGEPCLLHLATGVYYTLDAAGARVWQLLQNPRTLAELRDALAAEYDVSLEVCERDIAALIAELVLNGLIQPVSAQPE